jgi:hypothetical protein
LTCGYAGKASWLCSGEADTSGIAARAIRPALNANGIVNPPAFMLGTVPVAVTAKDALRAAPPAMMVSAYFNVADKHYISRSDIASVLA